MWTRVLCRVCLAALVVLTFAAAGCGKAKRSTAPDQAANSVFASEAATPVDDDEESSSDASADRDAMRLAQPITGTRRGTEPGRERAPRPPRDRLEAHVRRDPVEPGAERAAALEPCEAAPGPQERILERVLGIVQRAEHAIAVGLQRRPMRPDQQAVRALVPPLRGLEQRSLGSRGGGVARRHVYPL